MNFSKRYRSLEAVIVTAGVSLIVATSGCGDAGSPASSEDEVTPDETALSLRGRKACGGPSHRACPDGEYCRARGRDRCLDDDDVGVCAPRPQACTKEYLPVCGCDGKTYGNACTAAAAGVSVAKQGACAPEPAFCGGIAGTPCPDDLECIDDPGDDCDPNNGGADCGGICVPPRGGDPCGKVVCGAGLTCCNASCGICTKPGIACIQIACE